MADIGGTPGARLLLARLAQQIDEQHLVLESKDLRLMELDEEQRHVQSDIENFEARAAVLAEEAKKAKDPITKKRSEIRAHELVVQANGKKIRLLELDEEREQIAADKAASEAAITRFEAEASQQKVRLKESSGG